jgi:pyruvate kinase
MTRFRPKTPVLGVTNRIDVIRKMSLYWGVTSYYFNIHEDDDVHKLEALMVDRLKTESHLVNGDKIVVTIGDGKFFKQGSTNSIRVESIKDVPKAMKNTDQESIQEVSFDKGKLLLDTSICASCQACISVCPFDIWTTSQDSKHDTTIDVSKVKKCTLDMACVEACPTGAIEIIPFAP